MMKKRINYSFRIFLVVLVLFGYIFQVVGVNAEAKKGQTLGDLRKELADMETKYKESKAEQKKTENEINSTKNNIASANNSIEKAKVEITLLEEEMAKTEAEIERLKAETEELLVYYQKMNNENVYIEYLTGATSMTELIVRMDVINQFTDYNQEKINNMELLIEANNKMSKELEEYQDTLNSKIVSYEELLETLGNDLSSLVEGAEDIESEIKNTKNLIKYYETAGCKDNDLLSTCVKIGDSAGWLRPLTKGKVTSAFGMRLHPTKKVWQMHNGIDIGVAEGTKVYSSAYGVVGIVNNKRSCGGNMIYIWVFVNGVAYTTIYMHLLEMYVKVGDVVTPNDVIGLVGGGSTSTKRGGYDSCTTGAHLHYGVSKGHYKPYKDSDDPNYVNYSKHIANMINPPGFPAKGSSFYSR